MFKRRRFPVEIILVVFAGTASTGSRTETWARWCRNAEYVNNIMEADHGALKRVIKPTRGFQTMRTATATVKGFEIMRMIRRGHCLTCKLGVHDEIRFVNRLF